MYKYIDLPNDPTTATDRINEHAANGYRVLMMVTCGGSVRLLMISTALALKEEQDDAARI